VILFNGRGNQDQTRYKAHEEFSIGLRDSKGISFSSGTLHSEIVPYYFFI